jgi:hypothetical protein
VTTIRRLSLLSVVLVSCASPSAPRDVIQLEVSERIGACLGNSRAGCINVRSLPDGAWYPAELREFSYREGTRYLIEAVESARLPGSPHLVREVYVVRRVLDEHPLPPS